MEVCEYCGKGNGWHELFCSYLVRLELAGPPFMQVRELDNPPPAVVIAKLREVE
jgi:hypothetical protein